MSIENKLDVEEMQISFKNAHEFFTNFKVQEPNKTFISEINENLLSLRKVNYLMELSQESLWYKKYPWWGERDLKQKISDTQAFYEPIIAIEDNELKLNLVNVFKDYFAEIFEKVVSFTEKYSDQINFWYLEKEFRNLMKENASSFEETDAFEYSPKKDDQIEIRWPIDLHHHGATIGAEIWLNANSDEERESSSMRNFKKFLKKKGYAPDYDAISNAYVCGVRITNEADALKLVKDLEEGLTN